MRLFTELRSQIEAIITDMPHKDGKFDFDTHDFIKVFSKEHQQAYILALYEQVTKNVDNQQPFQVIHSQIGKMLKHDYGHLVREFVDAQGAPEKSNSDDTFGNKTDCAGWIKV